MLTRVTISGADHTVPHSALLDLSAEFPFVEWGILWSSKRDGTHRYPGHNWRETFMGRAPRHVAIHLCGSLARDFMAPAYHFDMPDWPIERVQINTPLADIHALRERALTWPRWQFILQAHNDRALHHCVNIASQIDNCAVLSDGSGGRGIPIVRKVGGSSVVTLPAAPPPAWLPFGVAGGIGPDNVGAVLRAMADRGLLDGADAWIDMESGVRNEADEFDLSKVRQVLETARHWVAI